MNHTNNFNMLRLTAAALVVLRHLQEIHLVPSAWTYTITSLNRYLPGVPIFFVISGFLLTLSWQARPEWGKYLWARVLRILPGYLVCTAVTSLIMACLGAFSLMWLAGQLSIFGAMTMPEGWSLPRESNPALWTIPIEIEFYLLLPLLLRAANIWRPLGRELVAVLTVLLMIAAIYHGQRQLFGVFQYFFVFGLGMLAALYWNELKPLVAGRAHWWAPGYLTMVLLFPHAHLVPGWAVEPVLMVPLAGLVLSLAYTAPGLTRKLLGRNDISYGVYLYHFPFIYLFGHGMAVMAATFATAWASWRLVEQPMLRLK